MSPGNSSEGESFRITDGDREAAVQALGEHYATGRLDKAEYDERAERAWTARTDQEVTPLFTDLPAPHGNVVARAPVASGARGSWSWDHRLPAERWRSRRRGPFVPWLFLVIPLAFVLHAPWLIFAAFFVTWMLRPARRWR
ncbi:MAG: DUF1707 domain-containing protein [Marmoricola sp.]